MIGCLNSFFFFDEQEKTQLPEEKTWFSMVSEVGKAIADFMADVKQ